MYDYVKFLWCVLLLNITVCCQLRGEIFSLNLLKSLEYFESCCSLLGLFNKTAKQKWAFTKLKLKWLLCFFSTLHISVALYTSGVLVFIKQHIGRKSHQKAPVHEQVLGPQCNKHFFTQSVGHQIEVIYVPSVWDREKGSSTYQDYI